MPVSRNFTDKAKRIAFKRRMKLYLRRTLHASLALLVLGFLLHSAWSWYQGNIDNMKQGISNVVVDASSDAGLKLKHVYISGQYNLSSDDIVKALSLEEGDPIMNISLKELKGRVEALGWVREATIERQLPSTLHVRIVERRPVAIWQHKGDLHLVDIQGNIISKGVKGEKESFAELPIIVGTDAYQYVGMIFGFLIKQPELFNKVSSVIRVGERRWDVRLNNDIEIRLPEKKPEAAWAYLGKLNKEKNLLAKDIKAIDLRLPDRIFVEEK